MIDLNNIHSLTEFQRNTQAHLRRLSRTGRPEVLTINGRAKLVVQDAASYQRLLDALESAGAIAGIRRGLDSVSRGEGRPFTDALDDLRRKYEGKSKR